MQDEKSFARSSVSPHDRALPGLASEPGAKPKSPRFIARQLALGFGSVSAIAVLMCTLLLSVIHEVAGLVDSMRQDESSIRQGLQLATAVRELSIHIAHAIIDADDAHRSDYEKWRARVEARIQTLASRLPTEEHARLARLGETTEQMHALLIGSALPAAKLGYLREAREVHRKIERLSTRAAADADAIAEAATSEMAHAHDHATASTRLGLLGGGLCALLVVALSVLFTLRLRTVVLRPLHALAEAALHYGRGNFAYRAGQVGKGELAAVGDAFAHMADELSRRERRLLRNERMAAIGQLAAGIAHELNNPIGIIRGYLKTMSPEENAETLREELAIVDEEAGHCQRIAEDLLTYARAEELSLSPLPMAVFLSETARRYEVSAAAATVFVEAQEGIAMADGARLRQVFLNLLSNAGHVSPPGAATRIRGSADGDRYVVEVSDRGPGVTDEDKSRIFEPFFSKRRGGSGLGLSVCEGIVRAHHGSIEVLDAPAGGAVFRVSLPLAPTPSASASGAPA